MAIFKVTPHLDDDASTIDVQFTNNLYGSWTSVVTDDPVTDYPKKFSDSRVTTSSYIRFRLKNTSGEYTDWSDPQKPVVTQKPEPHRSLCYVYGRLYDYNTHEPLNSAKVRFTYTSGSASGGAPMVRDISVETNNYGWFIVSLTPGLTYTVICPEATLRDSIVVPSDHNANLSSL